MNDRPEPGDVLYGIGDTRYAVSEKPRPLVVKSVGPKQIKVLEQGPRAYAHPWTGTLTPPGEGLPGQVGRVSYHGPLFRTELEAWEAALDIGERKAEALRRQAAGIETDLADVRRRIEELSR